MPGSVGLHSDDACDNVGPLTLQDALYCTISRKTVHSLLKASLIPIAPEDAVTLNAAGQVTLLSVPEAWKQNDTLSSLVHFMEWIRTTAHNKGSTGLTLYVTPTKMDYTAPLFVYCVGMILLGHILSEPVIIYTDHNNLGIPGTTLTLCRALRIILDSYDEESWSVSTLINAAERVPARLESMLPP